MGRLNVLVGGALAVIGLVVAAAGPAAMPYFGVEAMPAVGEGSTEVPAEWRLVAFARMFGITVFVLGVALFSLGRGVEGSGTRRFAGAVAVASGLAFLMALGQQTALWNTAAGAGLTAMFGILALAYGWVAVRAATAQGAVSRDESGVGAGNVR